MKEKITFAPGADMICMRPSVQLASVSGVDGKLGHRIGDRLDPNSRPRDSADASKTHVKRGYASTSRSYFTFGERHFSMTKFISTQESE